MNFLTLLPLHYNHEEYLDKKNTLNLYIFFLLCSNKSTLLLTFVNFQREVGREKYKSISLYVYDTFTIWLRNNLLSVYKSWSKNSFFLKKIFHLVSQISFLLEETQNYACTRSNQVNREKKKGRQIYYAYIHILPFI
jgi:hypothetical protein